MKLKTFDIHAFVHHVNHCRIRMGDNTFYVILKNNVFCHDALAHAHAHARTLDEIFHVNLAYHNPSNCFVISVWLAKSQNIASKYKADLVIEGDNHKLCFEGINVCSVENIPSIDKFIGDAGDIPLCLSRNLAKKLSVKRQVAVSFKKI